MPRKKKTKFSAGLICARFNPHKDAMEFLMVQKGFTYAFSDFVHKKWTMDNIHALVNSMTQHEKIIIYSGDFKIMWNNIWMGVVIRESFYRECEAHYKRYFGGPDGLKHIRQILASSRTFGELLWEPPKGHKTFTGEKHLDCAVREFKEETNLSIDNIKLLPCASIERINVVDNTTYISKYYIGVMRPYNTRKKTATGGGGNEVRDIRWLTIPELRLLCPSNRCVDLLKDASKIIKHRIHV